MITPVPVCPFLSVPRPYTLPIAGIPTEAVRPILCEGSRCALWVPELAPADAAGLDFTGDMVPTGRGCCSLNHSREPWPDPAGGLDR